MRVKLEDEDAKDVAHKHQIHLRMQQLHNANSLLGLISLLNVIIYNYYPALWLSHM